MINWQPLREYAKENKSGLMRGICFTTLIALWVAFYVFLMRTGWNEIFAHESRKNFLQETTKALQKFESRIEFWDIQAKKIASFVTDQSPASYHLQQETWTTLLDSHPEWLATHVIRQRHGFEPSVPLALLSRQVKEWFPQERNKPLPWYEEAKSSAVQLTSTRTLNQPLTMHMMRSMDKDAQWVQVIFSIKRSTPGWTTWVVHTFSSRLLPEILNKNETHDSVLFFPQSKKILVSQDFQNQKIETSELTGLLERNNNKDSGFLQKEFSMAKKPVWLSWKHSDALNVSLIRIISHQKIPNEVERPTPSVIREWLLSLIWMCLSAMLLWWGYSKKWWHLSLRPSVWNEKNQPPQNPDEGAGEQTTASLMVSALASAIAADREFCRHLLAELGPIGWVQLSSGATANVEVAPAAIYKGSWWILQNIDENRVMVAVGAASSSGLAAVTSAYSIRKLIEVFVQQETKSRGTESALSLLFEKCSEATKEILRGTEHVSLFAAVIELKQQKICYINAGYRAPLLQLCSKKSVCLPSYHDPLGLSAEGHPIPRWVNLASQSQLILCNVGARNIDLSELDESEFIKIHVYPFADSRQNASVVHEELDSEGEFAKRQELMVA